MIYLIVSAISLALMMVVYRLTLSRTTFHGFNRYVLLTSLALAAVLPLMHFQNVGKVASAPVTYMLNEITVYADGSANMADTATTESIGHISVLSILTLIYLVGMIVCLLRIAIGVLSSEIICHHRSRVLADGSHLVITDRNYAPFSWRNYIVISRKDYEANGALIITHEQAHIRHHHSIDLILAQLFCSVQWFNPAAWMLKRSLMEVHEFEADASVLEHGFDERRYQICLVRAALQGSFATTTNNFANCSTKKRIIMMNRHSTNPWARLRVLLMLPAVAFAIILASACKNDEIQDSEQKTAVTYESNSNVISQLPGVKPDAEGDISVNGKKVSKIMVNGEEVDEKTMAMIRELIASQQKDAEIEIIEDDEEELFMVVEDQPEFPGGTMALLEYLRANLNYPAGCKENNIQGRVLVSFVVEKDGSISNTEVVKSVDEELDAEALRVVSKMPNWKPGTQRGEVVRVKYTVPINFRLGD